VEERVRKIRELLLVANILLAKEEVALQLQGISNFL